MRIVRVQYQQKTFYAALLDEAVQPLNKDLGLDTHIPLQEITLLAPVMPTKVVCIALNYHSHAQEMGMSVPQQPVIFFKPPSAVISTGQPIILPSQSKEVHFEAELAVIMGKTSRNISPSEVAGHIFGYSCANDVTARDLQQTDGLYGRAKGFDTFLPIGPWIETEVEDPNNLTLKTTVNEELLQEGNTKDMIFPPAELISYISQIMTLFPGDVVLTGTPPGVGPLHSGDEVRILIDQVGVLINPVLSQTDISEQKATIQ
jgi:2-keto-4-pentenoate hydratase/2-oxohepta-3-ene-1,7-dioic acid hydratase in catechol pathway